MSVEQRLHTDGAALLSEVADVLIGLICEESALPDRVAVALQPVDAGRHVARTGDRGDALAADCEQVLHRHACTPNVVDVDVRQGSGTARPSSQHYRHSA